MDSTTLFFLLLIAMMVFGGGCKCYCLLELLIFNCMSFACAVYLYSKTAEMAKQGHFKMSKKQKRKDKTPGTIFD